MRFSYILPFVKKTFWYFGSVFKGKIMVCGVYTHPTSLLKSMAPTS